MTKKFYSMTEAAEIKQVQRTAIYVAIRSGRLEAELVGKTYMIPAEALDNYKPRRYLDKRDADSDTP